MPHILIVEDEPSTSWALAEGLTEDGFTADTFRSGEEAWAWLQSGRSDLVISSLRLPGMSGLELARKLRRGPHAQPVIIVTADGSPEVLRDLQKAGVSQCFPKPFPIDGLRRSVRQALETAERRRRRRAEPRTLNGAVERGARVSGSARQVGRPRDAARRA
jgi:DNA-binding NtrC family response regulator